MQLHTARSWLCKFTKIGLDQQIAGVMPGVRVSFRRKQLPFISAGASELAALVYFCVPYLECFHAKRNARFHMWASVNRQTFPGAWWRRTWPPSTTGCPPPLNLWSTSSLRFTCTSWRKRELLRGLTTTKQKKDALEDSFSSSSSSSLDAWGWRTSSWRRSVAGWPSANVSSASSRLSLWLPFNQRVTTFRIEQKWHWTTHGCRYIF